MCGNYSANHRRMLNHQGSPPRVRELLDVNLNILALERITPACAGITWMRHLGCRLNRDHPRVCGNYCHKVEKRSKKMGSPPRVRELPCTIRPINLGLWITPACAGITQDQGGLGWQAWDHPRVCGNYQPCCIQRCFSVGSPPRVRELRPGHFDGHDRAGITPACAGITV